MSDLNKMMEKLKSKKKVEKETPKEETPKEDPIVEDDADEENPKEDPKVDVNEEIAILQNDGVFRRELLGALRELINVQMVNAQALIDFNKKIEEAMK